MGNPIIQYNGKTINLPWPPDRPIIEPYLPRNVNMSLVGAIETIRQARVDVPLQFHFGERDLTVALRRQIDNLNQWMQQGNTCTLALDSAKVVNTTLVASEPAGDNVIGPTSGTGTINGQQYVIRGGPNYQLVNILSGGGTASLTLDTTLDYTFAAGSVFRDRYFWTLTFREERAKIDIRDIADSKVANSWDFSFSAYEVLP